MEQARRVIDLHSHCRKLYTRVDGYMACAWESSACFQAKVAMQGGLKCCLAPDVCLQTFLFPDPEAGEPAEGSGSHDGQHCRPPGKAGAPVAGE